MWRHMRQNWSGAKEVQPGAPRFARAKDSPRWLGNTQWRAEQRSIKRGENAHLAALFWSDSTNRNMKREKDDIESHKGIRYKKHMVAHGTGMRGAARRDQGKGRTRCAHKPPHFKRHTGLDRWGSGGAWASSVPC